MAVEVSHLHGNSANAEDSIVDVISLMLQVRFSPTSSLYATLLRFLVADRRLDQVLMPRAA